MRELQRGFKLRAEVWLTDPSIAALGLCGEGAYARLLGFMAEAQDFSLKADEAVLAALSGLGDQWHGKLGQRIKAMFRETDGRLYGDQAIGVYRGDEETGDGLWHGSVSVI